MVTWDASHPEGLDLRYLLRYSTTAGRYWERLTGRLAATAHPIDFDQLAGGEECRIAVVATDGVNTTSAESDSFSVAPKPCHVLILEPADGERFAAGRAILLRGQGYYLEEHRAEAEALLWTSDRDGELGRGTVVELRERLSPGEHEIRLHAGSGARAGRQAVRIYIEGAESATAS